MWLGVASLYLILGENVITCRAATQNHMSQPGEANLYIMAHMRRMDDNAGFVTVFVCV